jgi:anthranilate phosphoribosyltransferase
VRAALGGEAGPVADMIALNAGAAIYAADLAESLADGVAMARRLLADGRGLEKLDQLVEMTAACGQ